MNREFHGAQWEFVGENAYLTYKHYRVIVSTFDTNIALWSIWDKSNASNVQPDGGLLAYGSAANYPRACFQCETWLESQAGKP